jgi:hypothetical protein
MKRQVAWHKGISEQEELQGHVGGQAYMYYLGMTRWRSCIFSPRHMCAFACYNTPLQTMCSPSSDAKCLALAEGSAFVSVLAIISLVGQYTRQRDPFLMIHQMKWNRMSMCLVCAWYW